MAERIPQSAAYLVVFRAYLASDGKTPATGKTIVITISKNGATTFSNPAAGATNATEMASGFYKFTLASGDTDTLGPLAWRGANVDINDAGDVLSVVNPNNAGFAGIPAAAANADGGLPILSVSGTTLGYTVTTLTNLPTITTDWLSAAGVSAAAASKIGAATVDLDATAHQMPGTFGATIGDRGSELLSLYQLAKYNYDGVVAYSGTVNDISPTAGAFNTGLTQVDNFWNDSLLSFTSGSLQGQTKPVTTYVNANGRFTFDEPFTSAPANGDNFTIIRSHVHPVTQVATGVRTELATELGRIDVATSTRSSQTSVDTIDDFLDTEIAAILADTNELQTDWTNGGRLDLLIDAILDDTGTSGVVVAAGSKTGYALSSTGLDLVMVAGKTLPNAIKYIGAGVAGVVTGAGTGTEVFKDFAGTTAFTVTVDDPGNRSVVVYA